ncbi:hypothetical protein D9M68_772560 [compost metagenome]
MHLVVADQHVVLAGRVLRVQAQGVGRIDPLHVGAAELAVLAWKAERPLPLLGDHLQRVGVPGHPDEVVVDHQARRQHADDADGRDDDQPPFQFLALRLVGGPAAFAVAETDDRHRHEADDGDEEDTGNDQRDEQRGVDRTPVGRGRGQVPGSQEVEQHRRNNDENQDDCNGHFPVIPFQMLVRWWSVRRSSAVR